MKTSLTRTLMAAALLLSSAAHSNEVDDLKVQQDFDEMLILTAQPKHNGYNRSQDMTIPEWQRTGCRTHPDVINGSPMSICDRDANGRLIYE